MKSNIVTVNIVQATPANQEAKVMFNLYLKVSNFSRM